MHFDDPGIPRSRAASVMDLQEAIRRRAEGIYLHSGSLPGRDLENWIQAEREIMQELAQPSTRRTAIVIRVGDIQYVGEYSAASAADYRPGEIPAGTPMPVRFEGDKMFVMRPNGEELETTIVDWVR